MKKKHIVVVCMTLILLLVCSACSSGQDVTDPSGTGSQTSDPDSQGAGISEPKTAEEVLERMQAALLETPCAQAQMIMDIAMTLDGGEYGTLEMSTKTTNELTISQDPVSGYTTATVDVDYGGEKSQSFTENYALVEDGVLVSYIHSDGIWMKVSTGQTVEGLSKSASPSIDAGTAAIDASVTEYNGKEVICLTSQITGNGLQAALGGMLDSVAQQGGALEDAAETAGTIDYSALTCDARIYLDKETYLPVAEEMVFNGMDDVLGPLYEEMGMAVEVTSCTASAIFNSYEPQAEIKLPDGAAEKAEKWTRLLSGEPDNSDGTFTIREGVALIDIVPPEGFELTDKGYDHVYFERDDHRQVKYTAHYGTEEFLISEIDRELSRYGDLPQNISREQIPMEAETLSFTTEIIGVDWQSYEEGQMYAWAVLGSDGTANYHIFIEVTDGYNDGLGGVKSADITPEEFLAYLNAATVSDLLD